jgi:2-polyprenyl-3-methyl-5-hydroxy-6-metoxy-1,4-benzoquinol methylase
MARRTKGLVANDFQPVWYHRLKYFLSPQLDLYKNIADRFSGYHFVIDYGCGTGFGTLRLAAKMTSVHGIDIDKDAVRFALGIAGGFANFSCGDWCRDGDCDSWATKRANLVTCIEVIEHVESPKDLLHALRRSVKAGGWLVISTKNSEAGFRKNPAHSREYSKDEFVKLLRSKLGSGVKLFDWTLKNRLLAHMTPMVAIWQAPKKKP